MGWFLLFLSLHVARSLPSSFCSIGYMVRKKMLVEEYQNSCLVLGNLWYANGMILAISESPNCWKPSIKFLLKRIYGLEDVGWRISRWLFSARQSLICKWDEFSYFWVSMLLGASHQVYAQKIYGLEDDVWRIPRWLFSARQSLVCKWDDFSNFWVSMLPEAFHQVSAQEDRWLKRRCWLKNSTMAVQWMSIFDIWMECLKQFWVSILLWRLPSIFCSRENMGLKMLFEEFQDGCLVHDHIWYLNGRISAILCNLYACCLPSSFCSRGYMVCKMLVEEFQDGCLVLGNLSYANGMILAVSESPCCMKPSIKFLLKRIYGLEEDIGWRIPKWLFSARQSLICKWDDLSYFWVSMLPEAFHQVSAQEDRWFKRRCWLKNSKMAV